jgi:hypothetical protein
MTTTITMTMTTMTTVKLVAPATFTIEGVVTVVAAAAVAEDAGAGPGPDNGRGGLIVTVLAFFVAVSIGVTKIALVGWPNQTIGGWVVARWAERRRAAEQERERKRR